GGKISLRGRHLGNALAHVAHPRADRLAAALALLEARRREAPAKERRQRRGRLPGDGDGRARGLREGRGRCDAHGGEDDEEKPQGSTGTRATREKFLARLFAGSSPD